MALDIFLSGKYAFNFTAHINESVHVVFFFLRKNVLSLMLNFLNPFNLQSTKQFYLCILEIKLSVNNMYCYTIELTVT